jgi:DNA-binding response OmpR family regulator
LVARQGEDNSALPGATPPCAAESRPWVLCIDDDSEFSWALKLRLAPHGVDLLPAYAGMEGYRCAFENRARAILLDYEMPDGDGSYILRRLKENPLTQTIPVIVVSGRHDRALERKMFNLGAIGFLTKPIDWDALWAKLRPYVETRHSPSGEEAIPCNRTAS